MPRTKDLATHAQRERNREVRKHNKINSSLTYTIEEYFEVIKYDYDKKKSFSETSKAHYISVEAYLQDLLKTLSSPTFVLPMLLSERQIHQSGAFILFPNKISPPKLTHKNERERILYHYFETELVELSKEDKVVQCIIKIPKESKESILRDLKHFGITKDFVYPENIENISELIKNDATEDLIYRLKIMEEHNKKIERHTVDK